METSLIVHQQRALPEFLWVPNADDYEMYPANVRVQSGNGLPCLFLVYPKSVFSHFFTAVNYVGEWQYYCHISFEERQVGRRLIQVNISFGFLPVSLQFLRTIYLRQAIGAEGVRSFNYLAEQLHLYVSQDLLGGTDDVELTIPATSLFTPQEIMPFAGPYLRDDNRCRVQVMEQAPITGDASLIWGANVLPALPGLYQA